MTAIQYYDTPTGPSIVGGGGFDPWPGMGARGLQPAEMVTMSQGGELRFLASVHVTDGSATGTTPPTGGTTPVSMNPQPTYPVQTSSSSSSGCALGGAGSSADGLATVVIVISLGLSGRRSRRLVRVC